MDTRTDRRTDRFYLAVSRIVISIYECVNEKFYSLASPYTYSYPPTPLPLRQLDTHTQNIYIALQYFGIWVLMIILQIGFRRGETGKWVVWHVLAIATKMSKMATS